MSGPMSGIGHPKAVTTSHNVPLAPPTRVRVVPGVATCARGGGRLNPMSQFQVAIVGRVAGAPSNILIRSAQLMADLAAGIAGDTDTRRAYVVSGVFSADACLEAYAFRLIETCANTPTEGWIAPLGAGVVAQLGALWQPNKVDGASTIKKWERIYTAAGLTLGRTDAPVVAAGLLCKLRNFFAHGHPDTIPLRDTFADELAKELPKQFGFHPGPETFIAHAVLIPECAAWAFNTAREFSQHVSDGLGIANVFAKTIAKP